VSQIDPVMFKDHAQSEIVRALSVVLNKQMDKVLESYRDAQVKPFDQREWQRKRIGSSATAETDQYFSSVIDQSKVVDVRADKEVKIQEFLGINNMADLQYLINPKAAWVYYYIVLDSDYRDTAGENKNNITSFHWNYAGDQNLTGNSATSTGSIRDIVGMRLYQPRVPYVSSMDTDAKRVSVLIGELQAQSYIASTGKRFHFLLRPIYEFGQTSIELTTEDYNDGMYFFKQPITNINSFTISFGNPLDTISFTSPFDRFMIAIEFVCLKSDK
jgi:hypothetical protein